jgi:hypothetical protein
MSFDLKNFLSKLSPLQLTHGWGSESSSSSNSSPKTAALCGMEVTVEDVAMNLNIMKETLALGKEVDAGFIEILAGDIESLKDRKIAVQETATLSLVLGELAEKILMKPPVKSESSGKSKKQESKEELVGRIVPMDLYLESIPKEGLTEEQSKILKLKGQILSEQYHAQPVAKDGHCVFRAIAYQVVEQCLLTSEATREAFFKDIAAKIPEKAIVAQKLFASWKKKIEEAIREKKDERTLMNDPTFSNLAVACLRRLACEQNKKEANETLAEEAKRLGKSTEQYLHDMADMDKKLFAGEPELRALAQILDINIQVADLLDAKPFRDHLDFNSEAEMEVYLFYRPGHADIAVPKCREIID